MSDSQQRHTALEELLSSEFGIEYDEYDDSTSLGPDGLDLDSLTLLELTEIIEMKLNVSVSDETLEEIDTIGDLKDELDQ